MAQPTAPVTNSSGGRQPGIFDDVGRMISERAARRQELRTKEINRAMLDFSKINTEDKQRVLADAFNDPDIDPVQQISDTKKAIVNVEKELLRSRFHVERYSASGVMYIVIMSFLWLWIGLWALFAKLLPIPDNAPIRMIFGGKFEGSIREKAMQNPATAVLIRFLEIWNRLAESIPGSAFLWGIVGGFTVNMVRLMDIQALLPIIRTFTPGLTSLFLHRPINFFPAFFKGAFIVAWWSLLIGFIIWLVRSLRTSTLTIGLSDQRNVAEVAQDILEAPETFAGDHRRTRSELLHKDRQPFRVQPEN